MSRDLSEAKQRLLDKLGPSYSVYIQLLGKWFRGLISKEEFDRSAKQLISESFVLEHNKFWLAFFHHCANSEAGSTQATNFQINDAIGDRFRQNSSSRDLGDNQSSRSPDLSSARLSIPFNGTKVRCLPNKVMSHMKTYVIAWETGLDSAHDHVSIYINLALQHFLKNIITELICTKTAYRLRENRFKYAIGVKPMNPYLNNSLKIYSSNLEYDPYQIESNKMNSSLVDTYAYNDSLFPSRLYEAQALYEYACSTTSVTHSPSSRDSKRVKLSEVLMKLDQAHKRVPQDDAVTMPNGIHEHNYVVKDTNHEQQESRGDLSELNCYKSSEDLVNDGSDKSSNGRELNERRLTLYHLLIAFLTNRTIIPSQSLYSINLERIFTKLSNT